LEAGIQTNGRLSINVVRRALDGGELTRNLTPTVVCFGSVLPFAALFSFPKDLRQL